MVINVFVSFVLKIVDPKIGVENPVTIFIDDGIRPTASLSDLVKLKPVFKKGGSTTAGIDFLLQLHARHGFSVIKSRNAIK